MGKSLLVLGAGGHAKVVAETTEALKLIVPVLVHPTAYISPSAVVRKGTLVEPRAVIDHDVIVEDYAHVNAAAVCKARSRVGAGAK